MERGLILLITVLTVYVTGTQGTSHLSFATDTEVNITRAGCGESKLCVETPDDCDPTGQTSCLFVSVTTTTPVAPNGTDLSVQLRGDSAGYVALGLTVNASEGTTMLFICAQNSSGNGAFFFRTMQRDNNNPDAALTPTERRVTEIRGLVNGTVIQCEFNIPNVNATQSRSSHVTTFTILLGTGNVDQNGLSPFNVTLNRGPLNLVNPASNIPTTAAPTNMTTASNVTVTSGSSAVHPQAVLVLLSVFTMLITLRS